MQYQKLRGVFVLLSKCYNPKSRDDTVEKKKQTIYKCQQLLWSESSVKLSVMLSPYDFSHEHLLYEQPTTLGSLTLTVKQIIVCVFLSVYQVFKKKN